jgi:hypothetical protein
MGILDKLTSFADKAIKSVEKTTDKVAEIYKKEGVDGFLERADKGLGNLEKKATQVTEQATSYAKEIAKSNKVEIEKAKKDSSDDLGAVVNSSVAVAVNTVSTVARDVAKKAKELVGSKEVVATPEVSKNEVKTNAFEYFRFSEADAVALESVLKFVGAKSSTEAKNKFVDYHGNNLSVQGKSWYDWNNSKGGTGAVSLLKYELDLSYKASGGKPVSPEAIEKESVNILEQMALRQQVVDKEVKEVELPKAPAKKAVKKPAAKKVAKVVEEVPAKPARKAPAKKVAVKKPTMK